LYHYTKDGLIALARAAAGFLLITGAGESYVDGSGGGDAKGAAVVAGAAGGAAAAKGAAAAAAAGDGLEVDGAAAASASGVATTGAGRGRQTLSSIQELLLASCWCALLMLMAIPRFGGETPFADPLGGSVALGGVSSGGGGRMMVAWYALRCTAYVLASWGGLLIVKLAPMRYYEVAVAEVAVAGETKKDK
jgi:hypothetical protein